MRVERALQRDGYPVLAGMDEVGRGALAGPVTVGVVVIDESCRSAPSGVRDSKLLTPAHRERMVPRIRRWSLAYAVGHASNEEIDQVGIIAALRLAGHRALSALPVEPDLVILDGNHDWLTPPDRVGLFALVEPSETDRPDPPDSALSTPTLSTPTLSTPTLSTPLRPAPLVTTMVKADLRCSSVAAASVLAKVERDGLMVALGGEHPAYRWEINKGYAAPEHLAALDLLGPCDLHRRSWRLRGPGSEVVERTDPTDSAPMRTR